MGCQNCNKPKNIIIGWSKSIMSNISPNEPTELLYHNRLNVCLSCKEFKQIGLMGIDIIAICNKCKCPLTAKLRVDNEKCPNNKW